MDMTAPGESLPHFTRAARSALLAGHDQAIDVLRRASPGLAGVIPVDRGRGKEEATRNLTRATIVGERPSQRRGVERCSRRSCWRWLSVWRAWPWRARQRRIR